MIITIMLRSERSGAHCSVREKDRVFLFFAGPKPAFAVTQPPIQ